MSCWNVAATHWILNHWRIFLKIVKFKLQDSGLSHKSEVADDRPLSHTVYTLIPNVLHSLKKFFVFCRMHIIFICSNNKRQTIIVVRAYNRLHISTVQTGNNAEIFEKLAFFPSILKIPYILCRYYKNYPWSNITVL